MLAYCVGIICQCSINQFNQDLPIIKNQDWPIIDNHNCATAKRESTGLPGLEYKEREVNQQLIWLSEDRDKAWEYFYLLQQTTCLQCTCTLYSVHVSIETAQGASVQWGGLWRRDQNSFCLCTTVDPCACPFLAWYLVRYQTIWNAKQFNQLSWQRDPQLFSNLSK